MTWPDPDEKRTNEVVLSVSGKDTANAARVRNSFRVTSELTQ